MGFIERHLETANGLHQGKNGPFINSASRLRDLVAERVGLTPASGLRPSGAALRAVCAASRRSNFVLIPPTEYGNPLRGLVAERVGFEPTGPCGPPVFKTGALDHSATSPIGKELMHRQNRGGKPKLQNLSEEPRWRAPCQTHRWQRKHTGLRVCEAEQNGSHRHGIFCLFGARPGWIRWRCRR